MNTLSRCYFKGIALVGGLLLSGLALALAQTGGEKKADRKAAPEEKTFNFEMRGKPWQTVFEWLVDKTGREFSSTNVPSGTFNVITLKGKKYTIPQVIDIINDGLLKDKWVLLNRGTSYILVPADEKIDPALVPRVTIEGLAEHGETEIVSTVYQCKALVAEDSGPEVKKQLGPFGEVIPLHKANQLILQDTVANVKRIIRELDNQEKNEGGSAQADTFTHKCIYIRARDAESILRNFLGEQKQTIQVIGAPNPMAGGGGPGGPGGFNGPAGQGGLQSMQDMYAQQFQGGGKQRGGGGTTSTRVRSYTVTSDDRTNTVLVNGPPDKIAQAKLVMAKIDVGSVPFIVGPPVLQTYYVKEGNAEAVSKTLNEVNKGKSDVRIGNVGNSQIIVYAPPEDQLVIAGQINGTRPPPFKVERIPLSVLDAARTVLTLQGIFPDSKNGAPFVEPDTGSNSIVIRGTPEQVADVKLALGAIGESPSAQAEGMRIISLDKGSAVTLAEALQRMMSKMRDNPIRLNLAPGGDPNLKREAPKTENAPAPKNQNDSCDEPSQLVDPSQKKKTEAKPGAPVNITAFGNKMIVTSDDPEALKLVSELVRLLTATKAGPGDFEVIRLRFANAVDTAKILDEAFNGPKPIVGGFGGGGPGGFGGGKGGFGGGGGIQALLGAAMAAPREDRIRVVADPATNALLVQASPLDLLTIRNLLDRQLDAGVTDSNAVIKNFFIGPLKYASAIDVASVLRDVYRESMNNNFRGLGQINNPFTGSTRAPTFNMDANGNAKGVTLSLGTDDKTNSLLLSCPTPMYEEIKKLVDQLELAAKDTKQTVKIVRVPGVDPALIQQAIDALQGRSLNRATQQTGMGGFGGMGGIGGFPGNRGGGAGLVPGGIGGGFGGGGFPGGGGGFNNPTFTPGGGGFGGGKGGGGGGGGKKGGGGGGLQSRGPDFFEYRVKDDPQPILFDPRLERAVPDLAKGVETFVLPASGTSTANGYQTLQLVAYTQPAQPPAFAQGPDLQAPRLPVTAEALEQLGVIVIRANNPADMALAEAIVKYILEEGAKTQVEVNLIPLKNADATSVVNTLNQLYARIIVGPYANTQIQATQQRPGVQQGFPGAQIGFAGQQGGFPGQPGGVGQQAQPGAGTSSLVVIPVVRQNAILLAAPKSRVEDIKKEIARLDVPPADDGRAVAFPLKRASANRVGLLLQSYYNIRFPNETTAQHQIRITWDDGTNTVFVQAAPGDMAEIRGLIEHIDTTSTNAVNDLRFVPLRSAVATDLAAILTHVVTENFVESQGATQVGGVTAGAALGGVGQIGGAGAVIGGAGITGQAGGIQPTIARQTKVKALRLISNLKNGKTLESGIFDDVRISADARTNALIIDAPPQTMQLILGLIREMDVPPFAKSEVQVYTLKKADALQTALTLQKLFLNVGGLQSTTTTGVGGAGGTGGLGGFGGGGIGGATLGSPQPLQFTVSGISPEGAPIIDLRLSVDERTNSLVVAGSRNDLDVIESLIYKLEATDQQLRRTEAYRLRNALAGDVAAALNVFLPAQLKVYNNAGQASGFSEVMKDVVITAEPISNTLLISASPQFFDTVMRLIIELDVMPPQVMIQVLVAEVDIANSDEFGVEIGLQTPILFQRGLLSSGGTGTTAATLNQSIFNSTATAATNPTTNIPGFNFNNTAIPVGNNAVVNPSLVGYQGLQNLGVGRVSPTNGIGGFVFSAASNSFNVLVRALAVQSRIDILSRPQIMTLDNQIALINVGKEIPIVTGTTLTATGLSQQSIDRRQVGVILQVTPKIGPDGQILMRIIPEVSAVDPVPVNLGNGNIGTALDIQHLETTVTANDGETVVLGGLLTRSNTRTENKIPWLGDLPGIGALFRYRTQDKVKKELLIIMTPHIVRSREDAERIKNEEARKMDWVVGDVLKIHGNNFIDPLSMGPYPKADCVTPLLPRTISPKFEEVPTPRGVPSVPAPPPGQTSQAPLPTPVVQNQPTNVYPASVPQPGPALLPPALPASPMTTPTQTSQNVSPPAMQAVAAQQGEVKSPLVPAAAYQPLTSRP